MSIHEALLKIQTELKAPKGQTNSFGKYKYRSCEDILEALKPHLKEAGLTLTMSDEMVAVLERVYVKASASLQDGEGGSWTVSAFAREPLDRKGMDDSQITGSASSYARKYALNGLFCIDDTKDADTQDNSEPTHRWAKGEVDKIIAQTMECLEMADEPGLRQIMNEYKNPEEKIKVWGLFTSAQRTAIKSLLGE